MWAYDIVEDRARDGRKIRLLNVVDEFTRECLSIRVTRKLGSADVIDVLADLFIARGTPGYIRSDNRPEFIATAVKGWISGVGAKTAFIEPGSPWENGYVENFNGKLWDELLNAVVFNTLLETRVLIEQLRMHCNTVCPHSSLGYRPPAPEVVVSGLPILPPRRLDPTGSHQPLVTTLHQHSARTTQWGLVNVGFTGSTATGKRVMADAAISGPKPVSLEMGGKSPQIVLADADLDAAAKLIASSVVRNAGQICCAGTRLVVDRTVADEMVDRVSKLISMVEPGPTWSRWTTLAPILSLKQRDRITQILEQGVAEGAEAVAGGLAFDTNGFGFHFRPTIMQSLAADNPIIRQEVFGLVLADHRDYGLGAAVYTRDLAKATRCSRAIKSSSVWVNRPASGRMHPSDCTQASPGRPEIASQARGTATAKSHDGASPNVPQPASVMPDG